MKHFWKKLVFLIFFLASFISILGNLNRIISTTAPDFGILWTGAKDLLTGKNLYTNSNIYTQNAYPPISEIFWLPLGILTYQKALAVFIFLSFASIIGSVFLSLKLIVNKASWYHLLFFSGCAFLSFPTKFTLGMGQINLIVLFFLLLALYLNNHSKNIWAGITLGVAIALKPTFGFFLLFFIVKKSWKTVLTSIFFISILIISSFVFWEPEMWISWLKIGVLPYSDLAGREVYFNQGFMGFISRFTRNLNLRGFLDLAMILLSITFLTFVKQKRENENLIFSLFITTLLIIDSISWQHHFVWLMFPFITIYYYISNTKSAVLWALFGLSYFLVSWNFKNPGIVPVILLSNQFFGALILSIVIIYFLFIRRSRITS